jgi:hypothetical protein
MPGQLPVAYLYWIESRKLFLSSNWCSNCVPTFVDNILLSGWAVAFIFEGFPVHTIYSNFADFITYNGVVLALSGFVYSGTVGRVHLVFLVLEFRNPESRLVCDTVFDCVSKLVTPVLRILDDDVDEGLNMGRSSPAVVLWMKTVEPRSQRRNSRARSPT